IDEIDRIARDTEFNQQPLLDGTFQKKVFHIGANANQSIELSINSMNSGVEGSGGLGLGDLKVDLDGFDYENPDENSKLGIMTSDAASKAITIIQDAIELVSAERAKLGAYQNRLE